MPRGMMSPSEYIDKLVNAWNAGDVDAILEEVSENVEFTDVTMPGPQRGKAAYREWVQGWFDALSDVRIEPHVMVHQGGEFAALFHLTAKHSGKVSLGPGMEMNPTMRKVETDVAEFVRIDDSAKIVRDNVVFDVVDVMKQLGVGPEMIAGR